MRVTFQRAAKIQVLLSPPLYLSCQNWLKLEASSLAESRSVSPGHSASFLFIDVITNEQIVLLCLFFWTQKLALRKNFKRKARIDLVNLGEIKRKGETRNAVCMKCLGGFRDFDILDRNLIQLQF